MAKNHTRAVHERTYHHKYRSIPELDPDTCFYCGTVAQCHDHVPLLGLMGSLGSGALKEVDPVLIPSCTPCNLLLGSKPILTVKERAQVILGNLVEEYCNLLILPEWGAEAEDLTGHLKDYISAMKTRKLILKIRLNNLESSGDRLPLLHLERYTLQIDPDADKKAKRRAAIDHTDKCRKEHLRSLLHGQRPRAISLEELGEDERFNWDEYSPS